MENPLPLAVLLASLFCSLAWVSWLAFSASSLRGEVRRLALSGVTIRNLEIYYEGMGESDCALPPLEWMSARAPLAEAAVSEWASRHANRTIGVDPTVLSSALGEKEKKSLVGLLDGELFSGILGAMKEASLCRGARFGRDYSMGPGTDPGPMPDVASLAKLMATRAALANPSSATRRPTFSSSHTLEGFAHPNEILEVCSRLSRFGINDSILVGWLSGVAIDEAVMGSSGLIVSSTSPSEFDRSAWSDLETSWSSREKLAPTALASVLETEMLHSTRWVFVGILAGKTSPHELSDAFGGSVLGWHLLSLAYRTLLLPSALADMEEHLKYTASVRARVMTGRSYPPRNPRPEHPLSAVMSQWSEGIPDRLAAYVARLRLAQVGLALADYRSRHGDHPMSLSELGLSREKILDPFTGAPFVYRRTPLGVTVYSVGSNGSDEGGRERKYGHGDIGWKAESLPPSSMRELALPRLPEVSSRS